MDNSKVSYVQKLILKLKLALDSYMRAKNFLAFNPSKMLMNHIKPPPKIGY